MEVADEVKLAGEPAIVVEVEDNEEVGTGLLVVEAWSVVLDWGLLVVGEALVV